MFSARQSLLRSHDACPRAAVWETEQPADWATAQQALGTVMHAVAAEILSTLRRTGDVNVPTQEALVIAHEVCARPDVPHLSVEQMATLRIMTLQFAAHRWDAHRIVAIEEPLHAEIVCPDGVTRKLTGRPDVLIADPPGGLLIVDLKTGWAKPPEPRDGNWLREDGRPYLSERGVFQLDSYGYLAMRNMPAVERVVLREFHARRNLLREAYLRREDLEHIEKYLALALQRLDQTIAGIIPPEPRPGSWCSYCPRPLDCPIPNQERRAGAITDLDTARDYARRYTVENAQADMLTAALKGWLEHAPDAAIEIDGAWVGWSEKPAPEQVRTVHERQACPNCGAPVGRWCVRATAGGWSMDSKPLANPHRERVALDGVDYAVSSRSFGVHAEDPTIAISEEAAHHG